MENPSQKKAKQEALIRLIIRERAKAKSRREREQLKSAIDEKACQETIRCKLDGLLNTTQFYNFCRCGEDEFFRTCLDCRAVQHWSYQCCIKWCPRCNFKIRHKRQQLLGYFARHVEQPKHLILTQRNTELLTRKSLQNFTRALARFRHMKICRGVRGGCTSIEITNEEKGWHVHAHSFLDVDFIPIKEVAVKWGRQVGQDYAIVFVKDCREKDYLQEICKYVCDGNEMAKWQPEEINQFVRAVQNKNMFFSFGSLRKLAPAIRAEIEAEKAPPPTCECGCGKFIYEDSLSHEAAEITRDALAQEFEAERQARDPSPPVRDIYDKAQPRLRLPIFQDKISAV